MICSHPVFTTKRVIKDNQQHYVEEESHIELYNDQVITPSAQFLIEDVHDVSYRPLSGTYGFFYLHTIRGVYSFKVKGSPEIWMAEYKKVQVR
ncbi:hypothetical protein MUO14_20120 [Halobacillus shinanisalinarum]|uniref:Uncharacterized protein n=1 Tax=Halobacillus shinanisalinarum TaxID=2932258 RepID=A0ABY4GXN0_9BACI|nr:hypothetical protein [Halobacillus shinanisalinarum]UOQ92700.1 hypothetical protein MUO14_20120 [Halobacillus shinanisalinarum]